MNIELYFFSIVAVLLLMVSPPTPAQSAVLKEVCKYEVKEEVAVELMFSRQEKSRALLPQTTLSITNLSPNQVLHLQKGRPGFDQLFTGIWRLEPTRERITTIDPSLPPPSLVLPKEVEVDPRTLKTEPPIFTKPPPLLTDALQLGERWTRVIDWRLYVTPSFVRGAKPSELYDLVSYFRQPMWRDHNDIKANGKRGKQLQTAQFEANCTSYKSEKIDWTAE
jgi:hypothetical protein